MTDESDARFAELTRRFVDLLHRSDAPGGALAIVRDGAVANRFAYGVRKRGTSAPITPRTLFRAESITKTFTALTALTLVEEGRLSLDASIATAVPWLDVVPRSAVENITLHRLLTHTAGFPHNSGWNLRVGHAGQEYEALFSAHRGYELPNAPWPFAYSNAGYLVVGAAIETASGARFSDALEARVLQRLGMKTATADGDVAEQRELAYGHQPSQTGERIFDGPALDPCVQRSVGGLHVDVEELASFVAQLDAGLHDAGEGGLRTVLSPAGLRRMTSPLVATDQPGELYGYGIYVARTAAGAMLAHTGKGQGSCAVYKYYPERRFGFVALVSSQAFDGIGPLSHEAERLFVHA